MRLKDFAFSCWNVLYDVTRSLIENILVLKRISKNDPVYKNFIKWLAYLHGERFASMLVKECNDRKKQLYAKPKDKQELLQDIRARLAKVPDWKHQIIAIYERNNDKETAAKFNDLKKSVMYYTCPEYVLESAKNILITMS